MDNYKTYDPMVVFIYLLMRDYVTPGKVEKAIIDQELAEINGYCILSNGFLARYANDIVDRLRKEKE